MEISPQPSTYYLVIARCFLATKYQVALSFQVDTLFMGYDYCFVSSIKTFTAIALLVTVSCSGCWRRGSLAEKADDTAQRAAPQIASVSKTALTDAPLPVLEELPGVVTTSRHYPLLAHTKGRIKRIFFVPGQYVHKGDILVKGYDHNFVVAPMNALVAERLIDGSSYLSPNTVVASLLELEPFQIKIMPPSAYAQPVAPGWGANISRSDDKTFVASGVVLGSHITADGSLFVDLRLRRLAGGSLLAGTEIKAVLAPPSL
ncbi:efflux RND transporter periplasmic adaptor subunit [Hymenobacter qilianensis]|uniref:Efflux RND transporter periplasmic adaptor subunit n=1 Tax=Hymenobacter qilianensis TaxID=1385715 RepID=A0A7H0GWY6_9BACT|nr:efflux RND transporter periplasmic adaptor subunit [Hymenobacter qilianensis]QNP52802.1 efflux RND transporter periplasmic adaptor subunit [Hymenobacter qilianensis]